MCLIASATFTRVKMATDGFLFLSRDDDRRAFIVHKANLFAGGPRFRSR
jgi:hypothetical protein